MSRGAGLCAALALCCVPSRAAEGADDGGKPLPVDRTAILKSGTYYVEGRVRIPKGVEVTVQKDTRIVARGKDAVVEVVGEFVVRGVPDGAVPLDGVTIELQKEFEGVRTEMVLFAGASRGIVSPKDTAVSGRLFVLNTVFESKSTVDVTFSSNDVDLQRIRTRSLVRVRGVPPEGASANRTRLMIMNCCNAPRVPVIGAFTAGLSVEGVADVTVRANELGGDMTTFVDCPTLAFDANWVRCRTLEFVQTATGRFGRTSITKCDVQCEKVRLSAPAAPGKTESIPCDKCWFGGETNEKAIREKWIVDHDDDPQVSATLNFLKIMEKPLNLAGNVTK
jgi:hypothetical protein